MKGQSGKDMVSKIKKPKQKFQSFQDTILNLQKFKGKTIAEQRVFAKNIMLSSKSNFLT